MAEIRNSKRTLHQATYSPIEVKESPKTIRAWEKWSFFASLLPTIADFPALLTQLRRKVARSDDAAERQRLAEALAAGEALNALVPKIGTPSALATVKVFRNISAEALLTLGREHHAAEERRVKSLLDAHGELEQAYLAAQKTPEPAAEIKVPEGYELVPGGRDFDIYRLEKVERAAGGTTAPAAPVPFDPTGAAGEPAGGEEVEEDRIAGEARTVRLLAIPRAKPLPPAPVEASLELRPSAVAVARWALEKEMRPAEARQLLEVAEHYDTVNQPLEITSILELQLSNIGQLLEGFETRMKVEPIGFLHLERLSFTPAGVERGEMVSSIPLSPGEEVNFTHREWSNTSQEFEKLTTDYMESFSEQGVTEKSELAEAKSNQTQHSSGYNTGVSVSGGYGPVKIASSFNYNVQDSASSASEESRRSSQEITNKASSRSKREHKTSFRIASAAGTEDESVRRIKNPDLVNPMRVDYYRLIRKWRVDLERYGLRLTYDITIPEPGSDVLTRHLEIRELKKKVTEDFSFSLSPSQITRLSYHGLAAQYQASVEAPPPEEILYTAHDEANFPDYDAAKRSEFHALEFNVDERYTVSKVETFDNYFHFTSGGSTKGSPKLWWEIDQAELLGTTGKVSAVYLTDDLASYFVFVKVTAKLLPEEFKEWQLESWKSLYDAAESAFLANQQRYQNRITELEKEVEEDDALSLRKIEREEVMKGVLRWLFGPTFRFVPAGL
ncbi:MAG: hypothetical protein KDD47_23710, partial [Acidobacteria bacterium]|nr:hypothetical protein [Acidobacteriota bacterium]